MTLILQWNLDGYFKRLPELQNLISEYNPLTIALQETHLRKPLKINPSKYNVFRQDLHNPNNHACGSTALLSSTQYKAQLIPTPQSLQNIAISITIPQIHPLPITVCSIYIPPSHNTNTTEITTLIQSFPQPFVICGDFNAHSPTWGIISNFRGTKKWAQLQKQQRTIHVSTHILYCLLNPISFFSHAT